MDAQTFLLKLGVAVLLAQAVANVLYRFLPPADDSPDGINSKAYKVFFGILRRLSMARPNGNGNGGPK
jgi:hypothetical protein